MIEECIAQIVLHKSGTDPDFRHTKRFEIDVEPLIGEWPFSNRDGHRVKYGYGHGTEMLDKALLPRFYLLLIVFADYSTFII